jgi:hypothetical protein
MNYLVCTVRTFSPKLHVLYYWAWIRSILAWLRSIWAWPVLALSVDFYLTPNYALPCTHTLSNEPQKQNFSDFLSHIIQG